MWRTSFSPLVCVAVLLGTACGNKGTAPVAKDAEPAGPRVAPLTAPSSGVDAVKRMNFVYAEGWPAYEKAVAARGKGDTAGARAQLESSVAKDPFHLDAHYLLAKVLAQAGEHAAAVEHLVIALGDDYYKYGPQLAKDADFTEFLATPHGQAVTALTRTIAADYAKRVATGVFLVARRSAFKWPKETGVQAATTRGELYAYDRATKRYLRLSHTDHKVAGFVRAPSGGEVALLGFDKVDRPKGDDAATFANGWVIVLDAVQWQPVGKKAALPAARELSLGYGTGDQLVVATAQADGRWATKDLAVSSVDKATGKLSKLTTPPPMPRISLTLDEGKLVRTADGIVAVWSGEPPTTPEFKTAVGTSIPVPESHAASQASFALAPVSGRVAFATAVDPCAKGVASSLYVSDGKSTALKHLLTAHSRFANRWLDPDMLAYEDGNGAVRLWDARTGREDRRLDNKPGIALDVLSLSSARLCKGEAPLEPTDEPPASGAPDEPLPPEEPAP